MKKKLLQKGYTLVELVLYMGLLMTFIGVLTSLFGNAVDIQLDSESNAVVSQDATYILSRLTYDMHRAQTVVSPASSGAVSQALVIKINNVNYTYGRDLNGNLTYSNNLGNFILTTHTASISALTFTNVSNAASTQDTVKINMIITSTIPGTTEQQEINTTLGLRRQQ